MPATETTQDTTPPLPPCRATSTQTKMAADSSLRAASANKKDKLPERVVLWDETEVAKKQVNQVGTSACGATAVLNVLVRKDKTLRLANENLKKKLLARVLQMIYSMSLFS